MIIDRLKFALWNYFILFCLNNIREAQRFAAHLKICPQNERQKMQNSLRPNFRKSGKSWAFVTKENESLFFGQIN